MPFQSPEDHEKALALAKKIRHTDLVAACYVDLREQMDHLLKRVHPDT